jgi:hypothetical protein
MGGAGRANDRQYALRHFTSVSMQPEFQPRRIANSTLSARTWSLRLVLLLGSTLVAVLLAIWVLDRRPSWVLPGNRVTVREVDNSERIEARLAERARRWEDRPRDPLEIGPRLPDLLAREFDAEAARDFYPAFPESTFQAHHPLLFRPAMRRPQWVAFAEHPEGGFWRRFNRLGMREDDGLPAQEVRARILFQGDSHAQGVCASAETAAKVLQARLSEGGAGFVEVLNVARGSYNPFNYLGTLAAYRDLEPDAVVVMLYGGNDYSGVCGIHDHLFRVRPEPAPSELRARIGKLRQELSQEDRSQELNQVLYFIERPQHEETAVLVTCAILVELDRQCREQGVEFLVAYLPPPSRGAAGAIAERMARSLESGGFDPRALEIVDRLTLAVFEFLRERGIAALDLTPCLRACEQAPYWATDLHLSVAGQRVVAIAIEPWVRGWLSR